LQIKQGSKDGCALDPQKYDVFFYPIEAVGNGKSPVTASLQRDSTERFLAVVAHEDFHASAGKLPATITEPASTLVGLLTASELARERLGENSEVYRNLSKEPELFLRKAELVSHYHAKLSRLYAATQSEEISRAEALERKEKLFAEIQDECTAMTPSPKSFNRCLSANNNAGLAFDMTYAKYYPLMFELYLACGRDLRATVTSTKEALAARSEPEALRRLQNLIKERGGHMATATQVLRHEHEAILKMLGASEEVARRLGRGEQVEPQTLDSLQEFFQLFADRCHHGREEDLLFPLLEKKGFRREGGPIGVMLLEHERGRSLIRQMAEAAMAYKAGERSTGKQWAEAAAGYAALLRAHIDKENNVLFVMAERALTSAEQTDLAERFEKLEVDKMGAGTHERLHATMDALLARLSG
jgi:hemerythrin-like domain-containing protein